jgi:hypothetical protein
MRHLALSIAAFALVGLVAPTGALGREPAPKPKLTATRSSAFPDRTYVLRLPPGAATRDLSLTENGGPVVGLAVSAHGGRASGTYLVTYRSVLPPQTEAVVRATIPGFASATSSYTTPAIEFTASKSVERWVDSRYVTIFALVAVLALMTARLLTGSDHRY